MAYIPMSAIYNCVNRDDWLMRTDVTRDFIDWDDLSLLFLRKQGQSLCDPHTISVRRVPLSVFQ